MSETRPPAIAFVFSVEARPKVEIIADGPGDWGRLALWITSNPVRRKLLLAMLRLLREARESRP